METLPQDGRAVLSAAAEPQQPSPALVDREGGEDLPAPLNLLDGVKLRSDFRKKAEVFIQEYLVDLNASRAARIAWPSAESRAGMRGYECLHDPDIRQAIDRELNRRRQARSSDNATIINNLLRMTYDDDLKPEARIKASELVLKVNGAFRDGETNINILVGLAERLSDAKKAIEGEEVEK